MFEAFHAGIGHFGGANGIGHVAFEGDLLLFCFVGDGEDGFAGDERLKLDEIRAPVFQISDSASPVFWRRNWDGAWKTRLRTIEHRSRRVDVRSDEMPSFNLI